jgi:hypothetical protein
MTNKNPPLKFPNLRVRVPTAFYAQVYSGENCHETGICRAKGLGKRIEKVNYNDDFQKGFSLYFPIIPGRLTFLLFWIIRPVKN